MANVTSGLSDTGFATYLAIIIGIIFLFLIAVELIGLVQSARRVSDKATDYYYDNE